MRSGLLLACLLAFAVPTRGLAQDSRDPTGNQQEEQEEGLPGPLVINLGGGDLYFLTKLPSEYLNRLGLTKVVRDQRLGNHAAGAIRLGVRIDRRWMIQAEWVDSNPGIGNALDSNVRYRGLNALFTLEEPVYVTAGAGVVDYEFTVGVVDPEVEGTNRDPAVNVGVGFRRRSILGSRFGLRTEIRDYVSWFSVPGIDTKMQHHIGMVGGVELSIP